VGREQLAHRFFGGREGKIADIKFGHGYLAEKWKDASVQSASCSGSGDF
jgi:hypothetical protein